MALCESDRPTWSTCCSVEAALPAACPVPSSHRFSNGSRNNTPQSKLQPPAANGAKLSNGKACAVPEGAPPSKSNGAHPKSNGTHPKSNGVSSPAPPLQCNVSKPRSCILGIGTATPDRVFLMSEFAKSILHGFGSDSPEVRMFSERLCQTSGILKKNMAHGREVYAENPVMLTYGAPSLDKRLALFAPEAVKLGTFAAERAIRNWGGDRAHITHLITYSTSGTTFPALDMQLLKALGLAPSVKHFWVSLMGCHAGLIGLRTAAEIAQADAAYRVLVVCVEVNSVQAQPLNPDQLNDLNNHVVTVIFGDGAAGVVVGMEPKEHETPIFEVDRCQTSYIPDTDHYIMAKLSQSGLVTTLHKNVPAVVGQNSGKFVQQLLQGTHLNFDSVNWAVHPGGKAVVDAVEKGCNLSPEQLRWTRYILENYGNMSSPTILFVLEKLLEDAQSLPSKSIHPWTMVLGFGPGLMIEGILLKNC